MLYRGDSTNDDFFQGLGFVVCAGGMLSGFMRVANRTC